MGKRNRLSESSGTAGGYVTHEEEDAMGTDADGTPAHLETIHHHIRKVMHHHKDDAHEDGPHDAFYHPTKAHVHHHHHKEAEESHLARVKEDLEAVDGVEGVTQHHEPPHKEAGYHKVYPEDTSEPLDEGEDEGSSAPSGEEGPVKRLRAHIAKGRGIKAASKFWPKVLRSALQDCVSRKIPKIAEDHPEMSEEQRVAVAYSMCGEKFLREMEDEEEEEDESEDEDEATGHITKKPRRKEGADQEPGSEGQHADEETDHPLAPSHLWAKEALAVHNEHEHKIEHEEGKELLQRHKDELEDFVKTHHKEAEEGGQESTGETDSAQANADANAAMEPYTHTPKRYRPLAKAFHHRGMGAIRAAADHLHECAMLEEGAFSKKHAKGCHMHARALDALQGAMAHEGAAKEEDEPLDEGENQGAHPPSGEEGPVKELDALIQQIDETDKRAAALPNRIFQLTGKRTNGR